MNIERSSGILMHITSLPSAFGIGDLGPVAYRFVDFLKDSGHHYWQILPINPTADTFAHSPYSSFSAFAGNPLLISPELLVKDGFLSKNDLKDVPGFNDQTVEYAKVVAYKTSLLEKAYAAF